MKGSVVEALKNELLFVVRKGGSLSLSLSASHSLVRYGYGILNYTEGVYLVFWENVEGGFIISGSERQVTK